MTFLYRYMARLASLACFLFLCCIGTLPTLAQTTRFVSTTGTNANPATATTWATSTTDLQGAINASAANDQVWVAAGVYKPGGNSNTNRTISFAMRNNLAIYGGFVGTETTLSQRTLTNPLATTLSGEIGNPASTTDNSFNVVRNGTGLTNTAILDGFMIVSGTASNTSLPGNAGGGMFNNGQSGVCSPLIRNCSFQNNRAITNGGAVYNDGFFGNSSPQFVNCSWVGNTASSFGGAVHNTGSQGVSNPRFTNCLFEANKASFGGAIGNNGSNSGVCSATLTNCTLQSNSATSFGTVFFVEGFSGGIGSPLLTNCVVYGNVGNSAFNLLANATVLARYSLFETGISNYSNVVGNITTATSPFASTTTGQLAPCSPAINAGDPATTTATAGVTDLAGNPRFFASTPGAPTGIDMGAYEFQDSPSLRISPPNGSSFTVCAGQTIGLSAARSDFSISLNGAINTDFPINAASYGPALSATAISGPIKFVGQLTDANQGCAAYPAGTFAGKVALIRRGTCTLATKVKNAQDAGAIGVLIFNNVAGELGLFGTDATITIPSAGISKENGEAIVGALATGEVMAKSRLVSYSWAPATGLSSTTGISVNATPTQTTAYTVTASAPGVCSSQTVITVTVTPFPTITITASPGLTVSPGQSITLTASGGSGQPATSYTWSNGQTTNPLVIPSASPSIYTVTGQLGICQSTTTVTVNPPVCGPILYVTQSGSGSQNGSSWANAVPGSGLQMAINTAATCGSQTATVAVWVANGLYKPTDSPANTLTDRTVSFSMRNGVTVYGGFVGNETALSQRPVVNLTAPSATTLSGEIGSPNSTTDNSYQVISNPTGLTTSAILDGFVITGGNANGPGDYSYGGGVYNKGYGSGAWCSPQIRNCFFLANSASFGGAILNDGYSSGNSSPILTNCSFSNNTATVSGGAMFNDGISNGNSSPVVTDCSFTGNVATSSSGGAIYSQATSGGTNGIQLTNCILTGNRAANGFGGGIYNSGVSLSITRCMINENYAGNAGGLVHLGAPLLMINSMVRSNTTVFQASGIQIRDSPGAILTNCEISGNTSLTSQGGMVHSTGTSASSSLTLINCTVANNTSQGIFRAVWTSANSTTQTARTVLKNTIVANNPNGNFLQQSSNTILQSQGFNLDSDGTSSFTNAVNGDLVGASPQFVSTTDFRLQASSPAINAGDPATTSATVGLTDLAGNLRFLGTRIDMGAYESPCGTSRLYVRANATGANTGLSWTDAFTDLQSALTFPCSQSLTEVWVANGTYKPTSTTARTVSFAMLPNVAIYGGFTGTETTLSQRPAINLTTPIGTTLSGDIGTVGTNTDNSFHVISNPPGLTTTAILDGFMVTGGNADGGSFPNNGGGGILNNGSGAGNRCSPLILNCLFQGNTAAFGGVMYNDGRSSGSSSPVLTNCSFQANTVSNDGGVMFNNGSSSGSSSPVMTNCLFQGNTAAFGGVMLNEGRSSGNSSPVLTNCSFQANTVSNDGGVMYNHGASGNSSPVLTNCSFQANRASTGGVMFNNGSSANSSSPSLTNCVMFGNGGVSTFFSLNTSITARYSLFEPSVTGYTSVTGNITTTTSPFADTATGQLAPCSPAIDAGDPATTTATVGVADGAGNARFYANGRVDMGAFELQSNPNVALSLPFGSSYSLCSGRTTNLHAASSPYLLRLTGSLTTSYAMISATFGPSPETVPISGSIKFMGQITDVNQGCEAYPPGSFTGKVALIRRGTCTFITKVRNAQAAGAIGVLIFNNAAGDLTLNDTDPTITIPVGSLLRADGEALAGALTTGNVQGSSRLVTYSWLPATGLSSSSGVIVTARPTQTTTYTITASVPEGCSSQTVLSVEVSPLPSVSITATPSLSVSPGQSVTLTASGGTSYTWHTGQTGNTLVVPSASTSYYGVTSTSATCQNTARVIINPPACGSVVYVTQLGSGLQNGSNWANALAGTNLQTGIYVAAACATPSASVAVWVAGGTYTPTSTSVATLADRMMAFSMQPNVALYGGFVGTETALSQRPLINLTTPGSLQPSSTTLSGDIGTPNSLTDNSHHIIYNASGLTPTAILDGFVLANGRGDSFVGSNAANFGAAVYNNGEGVGQFCSPTFRHVLFVNNVGIAGTVANNGNGGGSSSPTFIQCAFVNNTGWVGGAMYNFGVSGTSNPTITQCLFQSNTASGIAGGGAIFNDGRSGMSSPLLTNCQFVNNRGVNGGAIYNSEELGGVSSPTVINGSFEGNTASGNGGAMYSWVRSGNSNSRLINCSFQRNTALNGGAIQTTGRQGAASNTSLTNCVVFGNNGSNTFGTTSASISAAYSLFDASVTGYVNGPGNFTTLTSPFADTATGQLAPCSPAINAGDPATTTALVGTTDLAGNPRFFAGGRIDMGAYEFQDSPSLRISPPNGSSFTVCAGQTIGLPAALSDFLISLNGAITNDIPLNTALFGPALSATAISGPIKFVGQLTDADQGCAAYPAGTFAGKVALIRRGTCTFATKVKNAQDAGATGVLIFNNVAGEIGITLGVTTDPTITIPTAGISKENGEAIVGALPAGEVMAKSRLVSYSWAPATGLSSTTGISVNATLTQTTAYTVTASAPGVCSSQTVITVTVAPVPTITITASPGLTVSPGQSITLTASGGSGQPATSYTWSNGQTTNPLVIPSASPSTYTVTGQLGSCQSTTTVTVNPLVCGSVIYVTPSGSGSQNGSSWANAVPGSGLQMAINTAATCGSQTAAVTVWVANGLYKPTDSPTNRPTDRTISFAMLPNVAIYGGFLGTETALSQRPGINLTTPSGTTLSGEIDNPNSTTDNSYHVISNPTGLTTGTPDRTALLDGFVITGGNANGAYPDNCGGGMLNISNSSPLIRNCLFINNSVSFNGGAVFNIGSGNSSLVFTSCSFENNTAANVGGAMYNNSSGNSSLVFTSCSFENNTANFGGAIFHQIGNILLTNVSFSRNRATTDGGAIYYSGSPSRSTLTNVSFANNIAGFGADIRSFGSGASLTLTNGVVFSNGSANSFAITGGSSLLVNYSLLDSSIPASAYTSGPGNLTTAGFPFVSATDLRLLACSPAINAGDPASTSATVGTTDLAGQARIFGNRIDMGAYEVQAAPTTPPTRLFVRASATGANTGLSWADAFTDLQSALTFHCSQCLTEIWVANGLYKPTSTTARTISFAMLPNVAIYGGFVGSETALSGRNLTTPSGTTLSGEIGDPNSTTDNSYHVISNPAGLTTGTPERTALLDGFVITGGNANGAYPDNSGGGMLNISNSSPLIRNCLFINNSVSFYGGAVFNNGSDNSNLVFTNCSFESNNANFGGAIFHQIGNILLTNVSFSRNRATTGGGAIYYGGEGPNTRSTLTNVSFANNIAGFGTDIRSFGSGASLTLTNGVVFSNGSANSFAITGGSSLLVNYSLLDSSIPGSAYTSGPGNLTTSISPFASTSGTQLATGSPAINAGDPATTSATVGTTDLAGNPRFINNRIDMGAYEFQGILEVFTLKDGLWNDASVWSVGRLPLAGERVRLKHVVTIPAGHLALSGTLIYDLASKLIYEAGGRLQMGQ